MEQPTEQEDLFELVSKTCIRMNSILDIDQLITFSASMIGKIFKADRVSFMLLDQARQELLIKASYGPIPPEDSRSMKLGEMFGGWVAQQGRPLLVKNIPMSPAFSDKLASIPSIGLTDKRLCFLVS